MLCQKCNKNTANVKIVKNINGEVYEAYLCSACAKEDEFNLNINANFFEPLLSNIFSPAPSADKVCPVCGLSYREFKNAGKFGCASCVSAFEPYTENLLKNIQGSVLHTGKLPKNAAEPINRRREVENLKAQLREAVENQDFENAAVLRDKIKELEG